MTTPSGPTPFGALRAVTLLGENTVPILDRLCAHLSSVTGGSLVRVAGAPQAADLVWGCGYLLRELIDDGRLDAEIVASPVFAGETEAVYHSVLVAADRSIRTVDDARGKVLAINEEISWSGHHALTEHLAEYGTGLSMFDRVVMTGSHRSSVEAVAAGTADVAAIDHTVWEHLSDRPGLVGGVGVIGRTRDWPAPPFAVHRRLAPQIRDALVTALVSLTPDAVPGLAGAVPSSGGDYDVMRRPPTERRHPPSA